MDRVAGWRVWGIDWAFRDALVWWTEMAPSRKAATVLLAEKIAIYREGEEYL